MLAWNLFKKSILLIADNVGAALRVSLLPYAILVVMTLFVLDSVDVTVFAQAEPGQLPDIPDGFFTTILVSLVVQAVVYAWIAVGWHRYILLEEGGTGWLPALNGGLMLGYIGRSILLMLLIGFVYAIVATVFGVVGGLLLGAAGAVAASFAAVVLVVILFYRLGLILPAGAVGRPIGFSEAWKATEGQSTTVVFLAFLSFALSLLLQVPTMIGLDAPTGQELPVEAVSQGPISLIYGLVVGWIVLMVGVSVLSTLYGHFVEGRSVD